MTLQVTVQTFDVGRWERELERTMDSLLGDTAPKKLRAMISEGIRLGRAFDGTMQNKNLPATQRAKAKKFGHTTPLYATGRLSQKEAWRIIRISNGFQLVPPEDRIRILEFLDDQDYKVGGIPPRFEKWFAARLEAELLELERRIQRTLPRGRRL